jgi:hypothetical protein
MRPCQRFLGKRQCVCPQSACVAITNAIYTQIKTSESQTLHLVLKPLTSDLTPNQNTASLPPQQAAPPLQQIRFPPPPQLPESLRHMVVERRQQALNLPANLGQIRVPTPPRFPTPPLPPQLGLPNGQAGLNHQVQPHHHDPQIAQTMQILQQLQQDHARLHQERLNQQHPLPGTPGALPHQNPVQAPPVMPSFQHIVAQHQRDRAALGMHGVQQQVLRQGNNTTPNGGRPTHTPTQQNRITLPQHTRSSTHEVNGPDGHRWTVTVNETTTYYPTPNGAPHQARLTPDAAPLRDVQDMVQNIVRAVDGNLNALQNLQHQHGTNSSGNPGSSASTDGAVNRPASTPPEASTQRPSTSDNVRSSSEHTVPTTDGHTTAPALNGSMVYILSSPTGPRGLLVSPSENGLETFYTPRRQVHWDNTRQTHQLQNHAQAQNVAAQGLPEVRHRREGRHGHGHHHGHRHAGAAAQAAPGGAHPGNPPAGAVAAQMWPHIWLVVRLLGFVWFFASGSNSWWRLFVFSAVAFIIFVASTGMLNGIVEQVWGPIRRHLENLLPLAAPHAPEALPPNPPAGADTPAQGQAGAVVEGAVAQPGVQLDPAQTAARLLQQRRAANENWIWTQFRRLEHATILFVASLVPGVGERHIAARVAEENLLLEAQRQRREAEAAAAVEAARAAEGGQENGGPDTDTTGIDTPTTDMEESGVSGQHGGENSTGNGSVGSGERPAQPLIEV